MVSCKITCLHTHICARTQPAQTHHQRARPAIFAAILGDLWPTVAVPGEGGGLSERMLGRENLWETLWAQTTACAVSPVWTI
jgi:hypothetical protein